MRRGTNARALGGFNQTVVLDTIRRTRDGLSRVEIATQSGLSAQTVSNVSRRLLESGLIVEAGQQILGVGKPRTILKLVPSGGFSIGVHIDPAVFTYVMLDLGGRIVAHASTTRPDPVLAGLRDSIDALITTSGVDRTKILGVGVASPGPIDLDLGVVLDPPLLEGWHNLPLREGLAQATGLPVLLEKDVTAAAVAELWMSAGHERDNFVFFYFGTGSGVGLALHHEVIRGATNNSGDAGHILVDPDGPMCTCGRKGCVGQAIMPRTLVEVAIERGVIPTPAGPLTSLVVDECFTALATLADAGDPGAVRILEEMARRVATAIVSIVSLLDLDCVVFGGPFWARVSTFLLARLPGLINSSRSLVSTHAIDVTGSTIGDDVAAVGAACLVLDNALSPRTSALIISA
jgi:predicted NBD/HSP70 family sugar kinase